MDLNNINTALLPIEVKAGNNCMITESMKDFQYSQSVWIRSMRAGKLEVSGTKKGSRVIVSIHDLQEFTK